ncbi:MAG TPA: SRPBCC domain-containing protein [Acidobacteriaceae bacterium]|nr:SRPBCC domain-containing protein [Acidobacteriaceae bacterium]
MKNPFAKSVEPPKEEPNDSIASVETIYRLDWERAYPQSLERVWHAISSAEEISAWMKFPTQLEPRVGGKIHIEFSAEGSLEGIVCNFESPHLLIYTWGDSLVNWKLEGDAAETKLHFSHVGVRPELMAGLGAGWHAFLDQLEDHLTGSTRPARYKDLKARYENAGKA